MREIFNFLNFGKKRKKKEEKGNIEVSKIFNFGNLKTEKRLELYYNHTNHFLY